MTLEKRAQQIKQDLIDQTAALEKANQVLEQKEKLLHTVSVTTSIGSYYHEDSVVCLSRSKLG